MKGLMPKSSSWPCIPKQVFFIREKSTWLEHQCHQRRQIQRNPAGKSVTGMIFHCNPGLAAETRTAKPGIVRIKNFMVRIYFRKSQQVTPSRDRCEVENKGHGSGIGTVMLQVLTSLITNGGHS